MHGKLVTCHHLLLQCVPSDRGHDHLAPALALFWAAYSADAHDAGPAGEQQKLAYGFGSPLMMSCARPLSVDNAKRQVHGQLSIALMLLAVKAYLKLLQSLVGLPSVTSCKPEPGWQQFFSGFQLFTEGKPTSSGELQVSGWLSRADISLKRDVRLIFTTPPMSRQSAGKALSQELSAFRRAALKPAESFLDQAHADQHCSPR